MVKQRSGLTDDLPPDQPGNQKVSRQRMNGQSKTDTKCDAFPGPRFERIGGVRSHRKNVLRSWTVVSNKDLAYVISSVSFPCTTLDAWNEAFPDHISLSRDGQHKLPYLINSNFQSFIFCN